MACRNHRDPRHGRPAGRLVLQRPPLRRGHRGLLAVRRERRMEPARGNGFPGSALRSVEPAVGGGGLNGAWKRRSRLTAALI
jgi:hypothetical protein